MLIGPKFVAIAYWHQLGVIHRCLWDTLGHSGTFWDILGHSGTTLGVWDCLWDHLEYFNKSFPDRPQKCYTLNLETFYTSNLETFSWTVLRSVTH